MTALSNMKNAFIADRPFYVKPLDHRRVCLVLFVTLSAIRTYREMQIHYESTNTCMQV